MSLKSTLAAPLTIMLRTMHGLRENFRRIHAYASLSADLATPPPASTVILGRALVYGTRNITFGENALLYPALHLETQHNATIQVGDGVVISRGAHLVAMAGIVIGSGTMIGEYTSIRDANHLRSDIVPIREAGHSAKPIHIGKEVWIGRGVVILGGVTIGDKATIGANAVVTRNVPAGMTVVGIPAAPIASRKS